MKRSFRKEGRTQERLVHVLTDEEGDLAAIQAEFFDQQGDDAGRVGVEVSGTLVVQHDLVRLARPREPFLGFVVLDDAGDVETASL